MAFSLPPLPPSKLPYPVDALRLRLDTRRRPLFASTFLRPLWISPRLNRWLKFHLASVLRFLPFPFFLIFLFYSMYFFSALFPFFRRFCSFRRPCFPLRPDDRETLPPHRKCLSSTERVPWTVLDSCYRACFSYKCSLFSQRTLGVCN